MLTNMGCWLYTVPLQSIWASFRLPPISGGMLTRSLNTAGRSSRKAMGNEAPPFVRGRGAEIVGSPVNREWTIICSMK
jgi:hypothetical protein